MKELYKPMDSKTVEIASLFLCEKIVKAGHIAFMCESLEPKGDNIEIQACGPVI